MTSPATRTEAPGRPDIDVDRLERAMVDAFREVAKRHWPWLRGDGWPAYSELRTEAQVMVLREVGPVVVAKYEALRDKLVAG